MGYSGGMAPDTLDDLKRRVSDGMRAYLSSEGAARTVVTKQIAEALVDARPQFTTRDNEPDLLGKSHAYQQFVAEALDDAEVPRDRRASVQSSIRYHLSPILRAKHGEAVERMGLKPGSTMERARRRSERDGRVVALFAGGGAIDDFDDVLLVANLARLGVSRIDSLPDISAEDREMVDAALERLAEAVRAAAQRV